MCDECMSVSTPSQDNWHDIHTMTLMPITCHWVAMHTLIGQGWPPPDTGPPRPDAHTPNTYENTTGDERALLFRKQKGYEKIILLLNLN